MPECGETPVHDEEQEWERAREERVEALYDGWGAREMAERIVELEDEIGANVDGICTGMHADVAEAHAEIERLTAQVESFNGWRGSIYEVARGSFRSAGRARRSAQRYRLAWLSARRRAADEANMGMEALELKRDELRRVNDAFTRLTATLADRSAEVYRLRAELRESTRAPRLEYAGEDEDGEMFRLA
jgi:hypothetical protein